MRRFLAIVALVLLTGCASQTAKNDPPVAPSGENGTAARCTVPTLPAKSGWTTIFVYFTCEDDPLPATPRPVPRQVPSTDVTVQAAVAELLKGPTESERAAGFWSAFSSRTAGKLKTVSTENGRAVIDFRNFAAEIPNASTTAGANQLLQELGLTVFQFQSVQEAEYRFDGSCEAFWHWLQGECRVLPASSYR